MPPNCTPPPSSSICEFPLDDCPPPREPPKCLCPCQRCLAPPLKPLQCKRPPCPCEKCKTLREEVKAAARSDGKGDEDGEVKGSSDGKGSGDGSGKGDGNSSDNECDCGVGCCNTSPNFLTFIIETIGIVAFMIFATIVFWLFVGKLLICMGIKIYKSSRNVQFLTLAIIGLLMLTITGRYLFTSCRNCRAKAGGCFSSKSKAATQCACPGLSAPSKPSPPTPPTPPCAQKIERQNITITITDDKAREIFRQSKLYAIPGEMKQPPALLVYLRDVILRNY